jgi:hypothetical protein
MFIFYRQRTGSTEVFSICGDPSDFPDGKQRFGKPLRFDEREELYYDIGTLVLIHHENGIEVIVAGRDELNELEYTALLRQIEHLAGRAVWSHSDDEPQKGWFIRGAFADVTVRRRKK